MVGMADEIFKKLSSNVLRLSKPVRVSRSL